MTSNFKLIHLALILGIVLSSCTTPPKDTQDQPVKRPLPFDKLQVTEAEKMDETSLPVDTMADVQEPEVSRRLDIVPNRISSREDDKITQSEYPDNLIKGIKDPSTVLSVNLVFDATDIAEVVAAFADENLLNFGYLIDSGVKGSVSMSVKSTMTAKEAWATFEHILWLAGAYASKNPGFIHILPFDKMPKERRIFAEHEIQPNVIVDFIPIKYKKSADIVNQLKAFMTDGATATDLVDSNTVVIVEAPANIEKLRAIIEKLDNKGEREWPAKCFLCREVESDVIAEELQELLPVLGLPVATGTGASGGAIKVTALPRVGAIVVSAALPEIVEEVGKYIKNLDRSDMLDKEEIYFYNVKHSTVDKLAAALEAFFNTETTTSPTTSSSSKSTSSKASSGSSLSGNSSSSNSRRKTASNSSSNKNNKNNNSSTSSSTGTQAGNRSRTSSDGTSSTTFTQSVFETEVIVYSDDESNRLTIKTTPRTWNLIKLFLDRQDVPPLQVSIKAIIADITLTKNTEFGVSYAASKLFNSGSTVASGVTAGAGALGGLLGKTETSEASEAIVSSLNGWSNGSGLIIQRMNDPLAMVKLIAGKGNTKILSEPQLVVRSGAEAYLQAGRSVALVTESTNYTSSTGNFSTNYSYEDVGVIMTVTPYVTAGHDVRMIIEQEVSDTMASAITTNTPDISKKKINTELIAPDNSTVLMGGMIRNSETGSYTGIPLLMDIPWLGPLFRSNSKNSERSELLVLLTVNVLDSKNPQEELFRKYKASLEAIAKRYEEEQY